MISNEEPVLEVVKLSSTEIIMRHRITRQMYTVIEWDGNRFEEVNHPCVEKPICIEKGLLFPLPMTTLAKHTQLIQKTQAYPFQEEEIINTFSPILSALRSLHKEGIVHGAITPQAVVFNHDAEVKLLYPGPKPHPSEQYAPNMVSDIEALGKMMLNLAIAHKNGDKKLQSSSSLQKYYTLLQASSYSAQFLLALLIMIKRINMGIHVIEKLLTVPNFLNESADDLLRKVYETEVKAKRREKIKELEEKTRQTTTKEQFTPPLPKHSEMVTSPKNTGQGVRKFCRIQENMQNKKWHDEHHQKLFEQHRKKEKKNIDCVLKKMSNGKAVESDHPTSSPAYKRILRDIRQTKEREDLFKIGLMGKRMRTLSKKKFHS